MPPTTRPVPRAGPPTRASAPVSDSRRDETSRPGPFPLPRAADGAGDDAAIAHASALQASTTRIAATTSLGRCQRPISVETPVAEVYAAPSTAAHGRARGGTTNTRAADTDAAAVVCPLGSAFAAPGAMPRSGRSSTRCLSTWVDRFAPP